MFHKIRSIISLAAGILIGITFIASGTGKLFGGIETPAQVMAFINDILPEVLLVPAVIYFIYDILVPYLFPIAELVLGICLLIGFVPRLAALLNLPLLAAFMFTNIWAIMVGGYATCASCFGMWEKIFGHLTPLQSLTTDIVLIMLALAVIFLQPGRFLSSRRPITWLLRRQKASSALTPTNQIVIRQVTSFYLKVIYTLQALIVTLRRNIWAYVGCILGVLGIGLFLLAVFNVLPAEKVDLTQAEKSFAIADDVTVSDITAFGTAVNFTTKDPEIIDVLVYDRYGKIAGTWSEDHADKNHHVVLDNLTPATTYYFQILFSDRRGGKHITQKYQFTTIEKPPAIANVRIIGMTDTSVTVAWETDRPTTTEITCWQAGIEEKQRVADSALNIEHVITLQALTTDGDYLFNIKSTDAYGHQLAAEYKGSFSLKTGTEVALRAPDFTLPSIIGENITLSQFRGKAVLLVFWNMTCPACRNRMPLLQKIHKNIPTDKAALLCIHGPGRESAIKSYLESQGLTLPVLLDLEGKTGYAYNVNSIPMTYLLDRAGIIRMIDPKFNNLQEFEKLINQISPGPSNSK